MLESVDALWVLFCEPQVGLVDVSASSLFVLLSVSEFLLEFLLLCDITAFYRNEQQRLALMCRRFLFILTVGSECI